MTRLKYMPYKKRTKMVCTIGPSSDKEELLRTCIQLGMNVARLNFSHNTHAYHGRLIARIRRIAKQEGKTVAILQDLQGPKIRMGVLPEKGVRLIIDEEIIFETNRSVYQEKEPLLFPVTYAGLHKDVKPGDRIFLDDGAMEVLVTSVIGKKVFAKVKTGGIVFSHKGMNFPDSHLSVSSLTKKDQEDLLFGLSKKVDWVALSFVTSKKDITDLRRLIKRHLSPSERPPRVLIKIEKQEALQDIDALIQAADGIMIARGDLGVETSAADVPLRQKEIIEKCRQIGKPVVVATQMLDSMIRHPRPTRAEVSDVANAVIDHADALMLSGETANGLYPIEAVKMMAEIIEKTEQSPFDDMEPNHCSKETHAVLACVFQQLSYQKQIQAIVSATFFGEWAELLNIYRPEIPLFLASDEEMTMRQIALRWGTHAFLLKKKSPQDFSRYALAILKKKRWLKKGMRVAVVVGQGKDVGFEVIVV